MSLTINNNSLAQQQALPAQLASTQASTASQTSSNAASTTATASPSADPSAALISGNAGLTSDLLSVLLQEQSGAGSDSSTSFASILDQQAGLQTSGSSTASSSSSSAPTLASILNQEDQLQAEQSGDDSLTSLDPALAAQSGTATDSVMGGLQDLLDQLAV